MYIYIYIYTYKYTYNIYYIYVYVYVYIYIYIYIGVATSSLLETLAFLRHWWPHPLWCVVCYMTYVPKVYIAKETNIALYI